MNKVLLLLFAVTSLTSSSRGIENPYNYPFDNRGNPLSDVQLEDEWSTFPLYQQVGYNQPLRPQFHFTSQVGWLNDPNGMVFYDGEWHMYFQHYAKGVKNGIKSWGNAKSTDLIHWTQFQHAINPYPNVVGGDRPHAIWSGSAVVDRHNALGKQKGDVKTLFALYTATNPDGFFQGGAYSTDKGRTWTKINDGKPVIPFQEGYAAGQRDPRIFYYKPGKFYVTIMMVGGEKREVRLWKSTDLLNWEHIMDIPDKSAECIDMYEIPVDGDVNNTRWVISNAGTRYEIGEFDGRSWNGYGERDEDNRPLHFDYGDSYYAAQVFNNAPDNRAVHIGWLHCKEFYRPFIEANMPFTQQMSFPAEITLHSTDNGIVLRRNPVREIERLYVKSDAFDHGTLGEINAELAGLSPELIDMTLRIKPDADFVLNVRGLPIKYDLKRQVVVFNNSQRGAAIAEASKAKKKNSPQPFNPKHQYGLKEIPAPLQNDRVSIRVLVDRASLEIFVNDGQAAGSFVIVPDAENLSIQLSGADGQPVESIVVNELKSIWGK
jgi:fructan beta-fructosidase